MVGYVAVDLYMDGVVAVDLYMDGVVENGPVNGAVGYGSVYLFCGRC